MRYGEAPTGENRYKTLKNAQSSSALLQRPLPEEPPHAVNTTAVFYDQSELESTYINVEGINRNTYERVSFHRKGSRRASLSKHAVIQQDHAKAESTYVPMQATNPLRDRSATSLGEVDTYATVDCKPKNTGPVGADKPKPSNDKQPPQLPPPYATSLGDTYATVDKPTRSTGPDAAEPSTDKSPPLPPSSDTYTVVNKPKRSTVGPGVADDKPPPIPPFTTGTEGADTYATVNKPTNSSSTQDTSPKDEEPNESGFGKITSFSQLLPK